MGGEPYWYVVPYEADIAAALKALRRTEFAAGRYNPVMPFIEFPIGPHSPSPGARHATIEDAMAEADADGSRSILDIERVSKSPNDDEEFPFGTAFPLPEETLLDLFGTTEPTREMVIGNDAVWGCFDRGWGIYVVIYADDAPAEIYFAGYSFD